MAVGLDPFDRLDPEERDRAVGPTVDGVVVLPVALDAELADPCPVDGQLRDAARRDVDLEHLAVHWQPILADGFLGGEWMSVGGRGRTGVA
jgi:hypothetical protein